MSENDHIVRRFTGLSASVMVLALLLTGCSIGITNQAPSPGGCVGEPARIYC